MSYASFVLWCFHRYSISVSIETGCWPSHTCSHLVKMLFGCCLNKIPNCLNTRPVQGTSQSRSPRWKLVVICIFSAVQHIYLLYQNTLRKGELQELKFYHSVALLWIRLFRLGLFLSSNVEFIIICTIDTRRRLKERTFTLSHFWALEPNICSCNFLPQLQLWIISKFIKLITPVEM